MDSHNVQLAFTINRLLQSAQQNPVILESLAISYEKKNRNSKTHLYKWQVECFYFGRSLEPTVAFIDYLTTLGFSSEKSPQFKIKRRFARTGHQFMLLLHGSK